MIEAVARHSGGHMRDAESLFGQIISLGGESNSLKGTMITLAEAELVIPRSLLKEAITFLEFLMVKDASGAVGYVNQLVDDGVDLKIFSQDVVEMARQSMLAKINPTSGIKTGLEFGDSIENRLADVTSTFELIDISTIIERFSVASREIKDAPIAQLPLELAIVDICFGPSGEPRSQYTAPVSPRSTVKASPPTGNVESNQKTSSVQNSSENQQSMFTQAALNDIWQELLIRIRQHNHSLAFVIKSCNPTAGENNTIRLAFKYKIHHDRLNDPAIRGLVEGLLKDISGQSVSIISVLDPEAIIIDTIKSDVLDVEPSQIAKAAVEAAGIDSSAIDNLLKTFGGKVVG